MMTKMVMMTMIICSESEFLGENCQMTKMMMIMMTKMTKMVMNMMTKMTKMVMI